MGNRRIGTVASLLLILFVVAEVIEVADAVSFKGARRLLDSKSKKKKKTKTKKGSRRSPPRGPSQSVPVRTPTPQPRPPNTPAPIFNQGPSIGAPPPRLGVPPTTGLPTQGNFGTGISTTTGFIIVVVLANGDMCFTTSQSFLTSNTKRMGAAVFVNTYGTLEGSFQCAEGARGFGVAVLTGQAFAEVQRIGQECRSRISNSGQGFSTVVGTGIEVAVRGEFGSTAKCPTAKG